MVTPEATRFIHGPLPLRDRHNPEVCLGYQPKSAVFTSLSRQLWAPLGAAPVTFPGAVLSLPNRSKPMRDKAKQDIDQSMPKSIRRIAEAAAERLDERGLLSGMPHNFHREMVRGLCEQHREFRGFW